MAYGDVNYGLVNSGSTGASADTAHLLFGSYGGLSNLNNDEILHIQLWASEYARVSDSNAVTNDNGLRIVASVIDLLPIRAGTASQLHFANETIGADADMSWIIWKRLPL